MSSFIGQWVTRESTREVVTLAHFVESEIADRVVTRCGRQMHRNTPRGEIVAMGNAIYCRACDIVAELTAVSPRVSLLDDKPIPFVGDGDGSVEEGAPI